MKSKIIMVISAVLVVSGLLFVTVSAARNKNDDFKAESTSQNLSSDIAKSDNNEASTSAASAKTKLTASVESTQIQTVKEIASSVKPAEQKIQTKSATTDKTKKSKIMDGFTAVNSWTVSGKQATAYAEKIALNLNAYKNGEKTSETVRRYGYFAIVKTKNAGDVHMITAASTVNKPVSDIVTIAKSCNALIAVNNEMCNHNTQTFNGFFNAANDQPNATVIKESKLAQSGLPTPSLLVYSDGTWKYPVSVTAENYSALAADGVVNSVAYTYPLIWNGEKYKLPDTGCVSPIWNDHDLTKSNTQKKIFNDHTVIGQIDANTYVFAVSEGFGQAYLAEYMLENLGVQNAYWGNGGHCSAMYIKGFGAVNRPNDNHLCQTADIICVK